MPATRPLEFGFQEVSAPEEAVNEAIRLRVEPSMVVKSPPA